MPARLPLNRHYGRLTVLDPNQPGRMIKCVCDCGNHTEIRRDSLRLGHTTSCGCLSSELSAQRMAAHMAGRKWPQLVDKDEKPVIEPGARIGRLTVHTHPYSNPGTNSRNRVADVQCDCGTKKTVVAGHLGKKINSCGCLRQEGARQLHKDTQWDG